jgi:hypothetical protein
MPANEGRRQRTPSGQKKGAIELSLGFIVAVVFSVVLLSLAIMWLNNLFPQFTSLTDDLTQQAQSKIQETFQQSQNNFAIWPSKYDLAKGRELKMSAGIKNDAADSLNHQFVINVIPASASDTVCPGGDLDACGSIKTTMQSWVSWDKQSSTVQANKVGYRVITVKPENAKSGTYIFNVVACMEPITSYQGCTLQTLNWGGSAQQFSVTLK